MLELLRAGKDDQQMLWRLLIALGGMVIEITKRLQLMFKEVYFSIYVSIYLFITYLVSLYINCLHILIFTFN